MKALELLSPAKDYATACEAILHGADAVYIGASDFGARAKAGNTTDDIKRLVDFAAPFGVKVYVTLNTIIFDNEIEAVERLVADLYRAGVDALIVQDMSLLEMNIPPIPLHASTQIDTRTPDKARMLQDAGFEQIVVARELDLQELRAVCERVDVPVEAFVHGALCVSYSGDCQASYVNNGRSANRGNCAQMCRLPYDLIDGDGRVIGRAKHYLSLRDLNRIDQLEKMADAGVRSFKIEGRLKDAAYVKNVTAAYRRALDRIIAANPDRYCRPSRGISQLTFEPALERSFNRGFTDYFFTRPGRGSLATFDSPKSVGRLVGTVAKSSGKLLEVNLSRPLANGDGLTYITPAGESGGFRANRVEGSRIHLTEPVGLPRGTRLFLSSDRLWEEAMQRPTAQRVIPVKMTLRQAGESILVLDGEIDGLRPVSVSVVTPLPPADKPDNGYRKKTLAKLGGTIFALEALDDRLEGRFVPASTLADLRRQLVDILSAMLRAAKPSPIRKAGSATSFTTPEIVSRHYNVANRLARKFYLDHGSREVTPAIEAAPMPDGEITVMTTRYCLRRELGACLKDGGGARLKGPLTLRGAGFDYRLDFDCANCQMRVVSTAGKRHRQKK